MTKSLITGGTALATTMAAQAQQADSEAAAELAATTFEAPPAPAPGSDFPTVHAHVVEVMRRVVKVDDAAFSELFNQGQIMPPDTRATTECMRGAIAMYEQAAALAAKAPIPAMLAQAVLKLDEAAKVCVLDEDLAAVTELIASARAFVDTARLAMDFQPAPDEAMAVHIIWNPAMNEGIVLTPDDSLEPGHPFYTSIEDDVHQAMTGERRGMAGNSLAEHFWDTYGEDEDGRTPVHQVVHIRAPTRPQEAGQ